jgi:hypothetical protein
MAQRVEWGEYSLAEIHVAVATVCARACIIYIMVTKPFSDVLATDVFEHGIFHPHLVQ